MAGHLSVFFVLLVSLRALASPSPTSPPPRRFAAWALVRLLGSIPITPGGIGVVELALTTALIGFGGDNAAVVASVLVFRFLTMIPTLVLGLIAAATWRRHRAAPVENPRAHDASNGRRRGLAPFEGGASPPSKLPPFHSAGEATRPIWSDAASRGVASPINHTVACRGAVATPSRHRAGRTGKEMKGLFPGGGGLPAPPGTDPSTSMCESARPQGP